LRDALVWPVWIASRPPARTLDDGTRLLDAVPNVVAAAQDNGVGDQR
jgi:hypothetical protein